MNSIISIFLCLSMFYTPLPNKTNTDNIVVEATKTTGIGFGRTKKNCEGRGLCVVEVVASPGGISDRYTMGLLSFSKSGSLKSISIAHSDLTKNAIKEFFSDDHFVMEESYTGKLDSKGGALKIDIPKGKYPIKKGKEGFLISFEQR